MSNHYHHIENHSPFSIDRSRVDGSLENTQFSHTFPIRPQDSHLQQKTQARTNQVPQPSTVDYCFEDAQDHMRNTGHPACTTNFPSQNDPTLAPEPSLLEFDLTGMLQEPQGALYSTQDSNGSLRTAYTHHQAIPEGPAAMDTSGSTENGENCTSYLTNGDQAMSPAEWQRRMTLDMDDFDYCNIDLNVPPPPESAYHSEAAMVSSLPGLSSSPSTQFELLPGIEDYVAASVSPTIPHDEAWSSIAPGYESHYPDPDDFNTPFSSTPGVTTASTTPSRQGALRDTSTDTRLVQLRREGKSYKQIKDILGLEEAESTLRGRFRTLTKPKEARVRKPEWTGQAVRLLVNSVRRFSNSNPIASGKWSGLDSNAIHQFANKVPWKQVAEWMQDQGTYRYGNATVKKRYLAVLKKQGAPI